MPAQHKKLCLRVASQMPGMPAACVSPVRRAGGCVQFETVTAGRLARMPTPENWYSAALIERVAIQYCQV
jgi:hypothetical protein